MHRPKVLHDYRTLLLSAWQILQEQLGLTDENIKLLYPRPRTDLKDDKGFTSDTGYYLVQNIAISLINKEMLGPISVDPDRFTGVAWYNLFRLPENTGFIIKSPAAELKNKLVGPIRRGRR